MSALQWARNINGKWVQEVFTEYDIPDNRTKESYKWHIEVIWGPTVVDEYWTDSDSEKDRVVEKSIEDGYEVKVTPSSEEYTSNERHKREDVEK